MLHAAIRMLMTTSSSWTRHSRIMIVSAGDLSDIINYVYIVINYLLWRRLNYLWWRFYNILTFVICLKCTLACRLFNWRPLGLLEKVRFRLSLGWRSWLLIKRVVGSAVTIRVDLFRLSFTVKSWNLNDFLTNWRLSSIWFTIVV